MKKNDFSKNYFTDLRELLTKLNGGMVNKDSVHPDIIIPNGSSEYRKTTMASNFTHKVSDKLRHLIQRFSRHHTKNTIGRESIPAM